MYDTGIFDVELFAAHDIASWSRDIACNQGNTIKCVFINRFELTHA